MFNIFHGRYAKHVMYVQFLARVTKCRLFYWQQSGFHFLYKNNKQIDNQFIINHFCCSLICVFVDQLEIVCNFSQESASTNFCRGIHHTTLMFSLHEKKYSGISEKCANRKEIPNIVPLVGRNVPGLQTSEFRNAKTCYLLGSP